MDQAEQTDNPTEEGRKLQKLWLQRIIREENAHEDVRRRMDKVYDIWKDDFCTGDDLYVPLLWSVVEVEHTGVYSSQPVPDVRVRNETNHPDYKTAARVLERGLSYCVDDQSFDDNMHRAVDDFLAVGLGVPRIKLDSRIGIDQMGQEYIKEQSLRWEYVPFDQYGWEPCNNWDHCDWTYYRHRMTQGQCKERFGRRIRGSKKDLDRRTEDDAWKKGAVDIYEVWCRKKREVLFIAKGEPEPIEVIDDPLKLKDFYPGPRPMMTNIKSKKLEPQPDYDFIEPYDVELNRLQQRRMGLMEQLKAVAMHDKGMPELAEVFELEDGESKPVQNLLARLAGGTLDNVMLFPPMAEKITVIAQLTDQIVNVKAQVDEILGIADIVRGVTAAAETATAQEIKGRWVGLRLTKKRDLVQYTVREMFRIMAQVLSSHFTDENLARMTQMEIPASTLAILRDDLMMQFVVDIESDSTVAKDENQEMATRQGMLESVGAFASTVLPMVQGGYLPAGVASAILTAALRPYTKYSRELDEELTQMQTTTQQLQGFQQQIQQMTQQLQQAQAEGQQWQQVATMLQQQSTQAKTLKEQQDAALKQEQQQKVRAETQEIYHEMGQQEPGNPLDMAEKAADIDKKAAEARNKDADTSLKNRTDPNQRTLN